MEEPPNEYECEKMIVAVDIETKGLDATKYVLGCIIIEGKKKQQSQNRN